MQLFKIAFFTFLALLKQRVGGYGNCDEKLHVSLIKKASQPRLLCRYNPFFFKLFHICDQVVKS